MGRLLSKYAGTQFGICYSSVKANTCSKLLFAFLVAISHSTTGNHIHSKTVWTVFLAPGQSNRKTLICHTRKLKRLLFVCSSLLSEAHSKQPVIYETVHITGYILSSLPSREIFCCMAVFFSLLFLPSSLWWCNTYTFMRQISDNVYAKADTAGKFLRAAIFCL